MGCGYTYRSEGELAEYRSRFETFLQDAASGDATVSDYRDALPDRRFVDGILPDEWLQDAVLVNELDAEMEQQFHDADDIDAFQEYGEELLEQLESEEYRNEILLDKLRNDDKTVRLHGTDLAGEYLHIDKHADSSSTIGKYLAAVPKAVVRKGYDRATPTGITVDELEEEQEQPGLVGRLTPSMGKTWAVLAGGVGLTATGAVVGDQALMDAGTVTAYSTLPMLGSNLYHTGRDEQYEDAIAERTADVIEQEIGDYTVDVIESAPFTVLTQE